MRHGNVVYNPNSRRKWTEWRARAARRVILTTAGVFLSVVANAVRSVRAGVSSFVRSVWWLISPFMTPLLILFMLAGGPIAAGIGLAILWFRYKKGT